MTITQTVQIQSNSHPKLRCLLQSRAYDTWATTNKQSNSNDPEYYGEFQEVSRIVNQTNNLLPSYQWTYAFLQCHPTVHYTGSSFSGIWGTDALILSLTIKQRNEQQLLWIEYESESYPNYLGWLRSNLIYRCDLEHDAPCWFRRLLAYCPRST